MTAPQNEGFFCHQTVPGQHPGVVIFFVTRHVFFFPQKVQYPLKSISFNPPIGLVGKWFLPPKLVGNRGGFCFVVLFCKTPWVILLMEEILHRLIGSLSH